MDVTAVTDSDKRKIELPRALREIVKILHEEGPMTYEELAQKLEKDETTVIRQVQKLLEMEIVVKVEKDNKTAVALAEGVEVDEEGNVYVPNPFEDPVEKLRELLEDAGVKGRKLRWIMRLVESNPQAFSDPNQLYDILVGAGIRRQLAQQIVKAFFGGNFMPPPGPATPGPAARAAGWGGGMYYYNTQYPPPWPPAPGPDRELLRLEMKLEKLVEELREAFRKGDEKPSFPVIRRVRVDETGKPVEVIEEPAWLAAREKSDDEIKLIVQLMERQARDREDMLKTIFTLQQETSKTIEKILSAMQQMQAQQQQQWQQVLMEMEKKRMEEQVKLREELYKRDIDWMKTLYEERIKDLQQTIEGIKNYYEEQMRKTLEELRREWEWRERLRELEERKTLRDVVVSEIKSFAEEGRQAFRELRQQLREAMEMQMKERLRAAGVPEVRGEDKRRILEALRRATGRKTEPKPQEPQEQEVEEVSIRVVGGEEG